MQLSKESIMELQKLLLEEFDYSTSLEEVDDIATSLVAFAETLIEINNESLCEVVTTE